MAAILNLQWVTTPTWLKGMWVQLGRSVSSLDFQHAALMFSFHFHLNHHLVLDCKIPVLVVPYFWFAPFSPAVPISCPGRHYILFSTTKQLSCSMSSLDNQGNMEIKGRKSTSLVSAFGKAWRDIYTSAWAPVKKCCRLCKLEEHWCTKPKFWLGESLNSK